MKTKLAYEERLYKLLEHFANTPKYGAMLYCHINAYDASLTVCPQCLVDDFCHVEGCELSGLKLRDIELVSPYQERKQ